MLFQHLQTKSRVEIWLYDNKNLKIQGYIQGFDEFMNLVLADAEEMNEKTKKSTALGTILLKGDTITAVHKLAS